MHHCSKLALLLLPLAACVASGEDTLGEEGEAVGGKADGAVAALEGTREGHGVLRLLNDGEGSTFPFLDDVVALDRRAATNLVARRDGPDAEFGTADDDLFDSIAEVDDVHWVGPATLEQLAEFARSNDYLPADDDHLGSFDGVDFTYAEAERVLAFVSSASEQELRDASVPSRAVASILEARPIASVAALSELYWVGPRTLEHLLAAVAVTVEDALCETTADCTDGTRCTGRPHGFDHGRCRDTTNYPGVHAPCDVDAECNEHLICIGQTVYSRGYCTSAWMRDRFEVELVASIPAVAMDEPTAYPVLVFGQASVPEDIVVELDIEHGDPSSLWIGLRPPTGQGPVTLWDGATESGPIPDRIVDRGIYRDDAVNGEYALLVQNVGGRGEGELRGFTLEITSRWD